VLLLLLPQLDPMQLYCQDDGFRLILPNALLLEQGGQLTKGFSVF
jgi:hypothetical protein